MPGEEEQATGIQPGKGGRSPNGRALLVAFNLTLVSLAAKVKKGRPCSTFLFRKERTAKHVISVNLHNSSTSLHPVYGWRNSVFSSLRDLRITQLLSGREGIWIHLCILCSWSQAPHFWGEGGKQIVMLVLSDTLKGPILTLWHRWMVLAPGSLEELLKQTSVICSHR